MRQHVSEEAAAAERAAKLASEHEDSSQSNDTTAAKDTEAADTAAEHVADHHLYEMGTFAQVHAIAPTDSGAQLLLIGHRRLNRTHTVSWGMM